MIFKVCLVVSIIKSVSSLFTPDRIMIMGCATFLIFRPVIRWWHKW